MLTLTHVNKAYEGREILQDLDLSLSGTGVVAVVGPSGCGKTTLLRLIAGLEQPDRGQIRRPDRLAFSFQEYRLFPQLTALQNACALLPGKMRETAGQTEALLLSLGFPKEALSLKPAQLSGGMKQRVSLARALGSGAPLILLDEPLKELDPENRERVLAVIREISGQSLVVITAHEAGLLESLSPTLLQLT